jgi:hypothetical protein
MDLLNPARSDLSWLEGIEAGVVQSSEAVRIRLHYYFEGSDEKGMSG